MSRPRPRGEVGGSGRGEGSRPEGGCIQACTEADTPQQTATAAEGTHPTGMHSCFHLKNLKILIHHSSIFYLCLLW